jgi:hypothetical protein
MYVYAAYNAMPAELKEDEGGEERWYGLLRDEPLIGGLELSFNGGLHAHGVSRLASLLAPDWRCVVTNIPGTLGRLGRDPRYGLASSSAEGREQAMADARQIHAEVAELKAELGASIVRAVELHSAPLAADGASSAGIFTDSLAEIASWEWGDVTIVIEHADALVPEHAPQKGFLSLDAEIDAVQTAAKRSGRRIRQSINWGRSAIETESAQGPLDHLGRLLASGTLAGLMFSGASAQPTPRSASWQDVHLAIDEAEPESILTRATMADALALVGDAPLEFLGVKVGALAGSESLEDRISAGFTTLHALDEVNTARV